MQKIAPFDQLGVTPVPDFVNAAPNAGIKGSIINCDFFNEVQAEILNVIGADPSLTPSNGDLTQLLQAIQYLVAQGAIGATEGVRLLASQYRLNFPGLTEQDAVVAADVFAYYDASAGSHVKIPFSVLAAAILAGFATQPGSAALLNPQALHVEERRAQNVAPQHYTSVGTYPRLFNTIVANQISGASLDNSGTATQGRVTLPAGIYRVWYSTDTHQSGFTMNLLYDYTHGIELSRGTATDSNVSQTSDSVTIPGVGCSQFTLTSTSVVGFQQLTFTTGSLGYAGDDSVGFSNFVDAWAHFEKLNGQS